MGIMADRVAETIGQHRPQPARPRICSCGYTLDSGDTSEQHQARAIVTRLYGTRNPDTDRIPDELHRGHPDNIALHRALGEPLCAHCTRWLDSRAG